ncbi:MAG: HNH endonuclease [Acidobacteria bacterium]|nr:HNH endonuclease [Acidobacteriota bacterium]
MQDDPLTQKLYESYEETKRELKYNAARFLQQLRKRGGLEVAKRILAKKAESGKTKGFLTLADAGRLDLSVEAIALMPQFRQLFSANEIAVAEERLGDFPRSSWRKREQRTSVYPDEMSEGIEYVEGSVNKILVNRYERDPKARADCLARHGLRCKVCNLKFEQRYGELGKEFIHVHHVKPLGASRREYRLDPRTDLVPVCPNCHAMLHRTDPPLSIGELKSKLCN